MSEPRHQWLLRRILLDDFLNKEPVGSASPTKRADDDENASVFKLLHRIIFCLQWPRGRSYDQSFFYPEDDDPKE